MSLTNYKLAEQDGVVYLYKHKGEVILSVPSSEWDLICKTKPTLTDQEEAKQAFFEWLHRYEDGDQFPARITVWNAAIKWYRQHRGDKQ